MRRIIARAIKTIGVVLLALSVLIGLIVVSPRWAEPIVGPARTLLVRVVAFAISHSLNGRLEIGALQGSLIRDPILRDIRLQDSRGTDVVHIEEVRLRYSPKTLLSGHWRIDAVEILRPKLVLVQESDGRLNLERVLSPRPTPAPSEPTPFPVAISLQQLALDEGYVSLTLPAIPGIREVNDISLRLHGGIDEQGVQLELQRVSAHTKPSNVALTRLKGRLWLRGDTLHLDDWLLQTSNSAITLAGTIPTELAMPDLSLALRPFDLGELGQILGDPLLHGLLRGQVDTKREGDVLDLTGRLAVGEGTVDLRGQINARDILPRYQGELTIQKLDIARLIDKAVLESNINVRARLEGKGLSANDLNTRLKVQIAHSHIGDIAFYPSQIQLNADGERVEVQSFAVDTSVLDLTVNGELNLSGNSNLDYRLSLIPTDLRPLIGAKALGGSLNLDGHVRGAWPDLKTAGVLKASQLRYDDTHINAVELEYEGTRLGLQPAARAHLRLQHARVGALDIQQASATTAYAHQNNVHEVRFGAQLTQSSQFSARVNGRFSAGAQRQQLTVANIQARLKDRLWQAATPLKASFALGKIEIRPFRLFHEDESIEGGGKLFNRQLKDVYLRATDIDLSFLRRLLKLPPMVAGSVNWQTELTGSLARPLLHSSLHLRSTSAKDLPFEQARLDVRYADKELNTAASVTQDSRQTVVLRSSLPLDLALAARPLQQRLLDQPLAIHLHIERPNLTSLAQAIPALPELTGSLQGILAVEGAYHSFGVNGDLDLQQLGLPGAVSHIDAPVRLTANVTTAPSASVLRRDVANGRITVAVPKLVLHIPSLVGELPNEDSVKRLAMQDIFAELRAKWDAAGMQSERMSLKFHADVEELPPTAVALVAALETEQLTVQRAHVTTAGSELTATGRLGFHDHKVHLSLHVPRLQLSEFIDYLPPDSSSQFAGNIDVAGTLEAPHLSARLNYAGARIDANATASLEDEGQPYQAGLRVQRLDLAKFGPRLDGQLEATLEVRGTQLTHRQRTAEVRLDLRSRAFSLAPGFATRVRTRLEGKTLTVDEFDIKSEPLHFTARGALSRDADSDLRYRLVLGDLSPLEKRLGATLQAKGILTGRITGALDALQTENKLQVANWRYGEWHGTRVRGTIRGQQLPLKPNVRLEAQIGELEGPGLPPSSLRLAGRYGSGRGNFSLDVNDGRFARSMVFGRLSTEPGLTVLVDRLRLQTEEWAWNNDGPIKLVYAEPGTLRIQGLELSDAAQHISLHGSLASSGSVSVNARIKDLQITPAVNSIAPTLPVPDGQLFLALTLEGTVKQPRLDASLEIRRLRWQHQPLGDVKARVTSNGTVFRGNATWLDRNKELAALQGRVDTVDSQEIAVAFRIPDFELARLEPLTSEIQQSAGRLRVNLMLKGTLHQPLIDGDFELRDGRLQLASTGVTYTDIQTGLVFEGDRIAIERLQGRSGTGSMQLDGWLQMDGLMLNQADLELLSTDFTAINTYGLEAVVSSDISLRGGPNEMVASGGIEVERARVRYEDLPSSGPAEVEPWELTVDGVYGRGSGTTTFAAGEAGVAGNADPLSFLSADIQLEMPRNAWVQGKGTAVELGGKLQIKKKQQHPFVLAGDVETLRGFATLLGRKFIIDKGVVTFTGSEDINPILDVSASYKISDYIIYVDVVGKSKKPDINYRSEPELDQGDILSLLVFGKTSDRLTNSEQNTLGSKAEQLAGGLAAGLLEQTVGKALGLDTIAIEVGDEGSGSSVGAGRYLSQDVYVEYERKLRDPTTQGNRGGNAVTLEYSIQKGFKVRGTGSDYGETAVDFLWSYDY